MEFPHVETGNCWDGSVCAGWEGGEVAGVQIGFISFQILIIFFCLRPNNTKIFLL
jgi:hypothetical protein